MRHLKVFRAQTPKTPENHEHIITHFDKKVKQPSRGKHFVPHQKTIFYHLKNQHFYKKSFSFFKNVNIIYPTSALKRCAYPYFWHIFTTKQVGFWLIFCLVNIFYHALLYHRCTPKWISPTVCERCTNLRAYFLHIVKM